jgi:hypothetical protein
LGKDKRPNARLGETLPLDGAAVLILGPHALKSKPLIFVNGLRAPPWRGLVILLTGDGETLRRVFTGRRG